MDIKQGAQEMLAFTAATYVPTHQYVRVEEAKFRHLDLKFYRRTRDDLERRGFLFLGDFEDATLAVVPGHVLMPVMLRCLVSKDGTIMAGLYHGRIRHLWLRLLTTVMRRPPRPTIDLETEFQDGSFVCTSNAGPSAGAIQLPPTISGEIHPPLTPISVLLPRHLERVDAKRRTGIEPRPNLTAEAVQEAQNRQNALKSAFRASVGGITKQELQALSSPLTRHVVEPLSAEIVAQNAKASAEPRPPERT